MFKELFPLAAQGAFSLLLSADEASGLMTVVVVPKHSEGGKDVPALAMPLKLTAVPDELDAGFVQALLSYSTHRASLDEQAAAVKKGADAVTKAGTKPAQRVAAPNAAADDDHADDEHGGDDADDAPAAVSGVAPAASPAAAPGVPDLFGA